MRRIGICLGLVSVLLCTASGAQIFSPRGKDVEEKRSKVRKQRDEMLAELYRTNPNMEEKIKNAAGYATFKTKDVNLLLVSSGSGYGMIVDDAGNETFMRIASLGAGVGMGLQDLRVIFIFNDAAFMHTFIDQGWQFGGKADASAKYQDTGAAATQSVKATPDFREGSVATSASADVRAGANEDQGGAAGGVAGNTIEIYQFTESGLALQATVAGTKYWKDKELNAK